MLKIRANETKDEEGMSPVPGFLNRLELKTLAEKSEEG